MAELACPGWLTGWVGLFVDDDWDYLRFNNKLCLMALMCITYFFYSFYVIMLIINIFAFIQNFNSCMVILLRFHLCLISSNTYSLYIIFYVVIIIIPTWNWTFYIQPHSCEFELESFFHAMNWMPAVVGCCRRRRRGCGFTILRYFRPSGGGDAYFYPAAI